MSDKEFENLTPEQHHLQEATKRLESLELDNLKLEVESLCLANNRLEKRLDKTIKYAASIRKKLTDLEDEMHKMQVIMINYLNNKGE